MKRNTEISAPEIDIDSGERQDNTGSFFHTTMTFPANCTIFSE